MSVEPRQYGTECSNNGGVQVPAVLRVIPARLMFDIVTHPKQSLSEISVICVHVVYTDIHKDRQTDRHIYTDTHEYM